MRKDIRSSSSPQRAPPDRLRPHWLHRFVPVFVLTFNFSYRGRLRLTWVRVLALDGSHLTSG
jgi:hypothetical protein